MRPPAKILLLRLTSLGDVILATAALGGVPETATADWVVSKEYAGLLSGHPRIRRVVGFDRKSGWKGWVRLCRALWAEDYTDVYDLHRSLRTQGARLLFALWRLAAGGRGPRWSTIAKGRWRRWGHFLLKARWPERLRPPRWVEAFSRQIDDDPSHRPDLTHLLRGRESNPQPLALVRGAYVCLVPSTRWPAKEWPAARYLELVRRLAEGPGRLLPVILGMPTDTVAAELVRSLKAEGLEHRDAIGKLDWPALARVLSDARAVVGGDTGLMHLAEAIGTPTLVLYGPTVPEMGFGPWREASASVGLDLWCRPCGKDGRYCYRPLKRYHCLRALDADTVRAALKEQLK